MPAQGDMVKFRDSQGTVHEGIIIKVKYIERTKADGTRLRTDTQFVISEFNTGTEWTDVGEGLVVEVTGHI